MNEAYWGLLGVNWVPSHASDKHAWVTCHCYQPPPLFIRPRTPTAAVRVWINTAGSISTYMTRPVISGNHTHTRGYSMCCLSSSGTSLWLCRSFRPVLNTHTPKSQSRSEWQTTGSGWAEKYLFFSLNSVSGTDSTALPSPLTPTAPVGPSRVVDLPCWCVLNVRLMCNVPGRYACFELQAEQTVSICVCQMCVIKESIVLLSKSLLSLSLSLFAFSSFNE